MTKRFLFLDDDPTRHAAFDRMTIGCLTTHVWTVEECVNALLKEKPFDCVFLDHDLGGQIYVKEVVGSGTEVAMFICSSLPQEQYPREFCIHSWNPEGAKRMEEYISKTGVPTKRIPFRAFC